MKYVMLCSRSISSKDCASRSEYFGVKSTLVSPVYITLYVSSIITSKSLSKSPPDPCRSSASPLSSKLSTVSSIKRRHSNRCTGSCNIALSNIYYLWNENSNCMRLSTSSSETVDDFDPPALLIFLVNHLKRSAVASTSFIAP